MSALWTARLCCSPNEIDGLMQQWETLTPTPLAVSAVEKTLSQWWVEAIYDHEPSSAALENELGRAVTLTGLEGQNWVARSLEGLKPVRAGRFIVYGAHDAATIPKNLVRLQIEASLAFGTGHHDTTRGRLLAIDTWLKRSSSSRVRALDVGTGTGVLALAIAKVAHTRVTATDIDPVAVSVTAANARANGVRSLISSVAADGLAHRHVKSQGPYNLIVANILAKPLARLAPQIVSAAQPGATVILSGVLTTQARFVFGAYHARGCRLVERLVLGEWTTLVLEKI
jgi:ribosomal protein L11 methyltransferase